MIGVGIVTVAGIGILAGIVIVIVFRVVIGIVIVIVIVVCLYGLSFSGSSYYVGRWWGHGGSYPPGPSPCPCLMALGGVCRPHTFVSIQRRCGDGLPSFCFWGGSVCLVYSLPCPL